MFYGLSNTHGKQLLYWRAWYGTQSGAVLKTIKVISHLQNQCGDGDGGALLCSRLLFATPLTAAHQATLSMGFSRPRTLEWVAIFSSRGASQPRDQNCVPCIGGGLFTAEPPGKPKTNAKVAQPSPALCDPLDYTVHRLLQARLLEWVAFPFSRGSSQPKDQTQASCIAGGFFTSWATREAQE